MVEIAGKAYDVPEGITIIKALWYTGHDVIRGAGCWVVFAARAPPTID